MSDTLKTLSCPACGKKMKKIFVENANCNVDICLDGCGGIFFDNREYKKFDEQHENIDEIVNIYQNKTYNKVNENQSRVCPVCGANMVKHFTSVKKEVEIDECYACGAIFLDYGELESIRKQYKTEDERSRAFEQLFEKEIDISSFKDYRAKTTEEMHGKRIANTVRNIDEIGCNIRNVLSRFLPF